MTLESIAPVIDTVYPADDALVFVILGDAERIRSVLSRYGALYELSITDPVFAVTIEPLTESPETPQPEQ